MDYQNIIVKLYPHYAVYERKVRYMILLMVTRSYGDKWVDNTIDDDTKTSISEKARSGFSNINMDEVLEYFDLAELENYLFCLRRWTLTITYIMS